MCETGHCFVHGQAERAVQVDALTDSAANVGHPEGYADVAVQAVLGLLPPYAMQGDSLTRVSPKNHSIKIYLFHLSDLNHLV